MLVWLKLPIINHSTFFLTNVYRFSSLYTIKTNKCKIFYYVFQKLKKKAFYFAVVKLGIWFFGPRFILTSVCVTRTQIKGARQREYIGRRDLGVTCARAVCKNGVALSPSVWFWPQARVNYAFKDRDKKEKVNQSAWKLDERVARETCEWLKLKKIRKEVNRELVWLHQSDGSLLRIDRFCFFNLTIFLLWDPPVSILNFMGKFVK